MEYACGPVADFDASAPRYTCTVDTPTAPSNSSKRSLLGIGMLAGSAVYRRL
ncbi:hypothetical protein [Actinacidiphila reveromycinica]|uniref:hypothetical protein n=1 Tax=Actinacidiphila reveromycinica TaxID=659352 RepID=UPI001F1B3B3A|nr:hypothetical protein [Streptomyces sp. SN-593]